MSRHSRIFNKNCECSDSMGCILRLYFRGGTRLREVPSKYNKKCASELEYGLHSAKVASGELALPVLFYAWVRSKAKAVSDGTKNFAHTQIY